MTKAEREVRRAMDEAGDLPGLQEAIAAQVRAMVKAGKRCAKAYERFHWGRAVDATVTWTAPMVLPGAVLVQLGELVELTYRTTKDESADWVHAFQNQRPVLASTQSGRLVVVGGDYRITRSGIEG